MPERAEGEIHQKEEEEEKMLGEAVQDLIGDVHMQLSVRTSESMELHRFLPRVSAIVQKMQVAGRLCSDEVAEQVKRKNVGSPLAPGPACSVS